jgi:hypothetical protein
MTPSLRRLQLSTLPEIFAIVGLLKGDQLPAWATQGSFFSVTRTSEELSIIVEESHVPSGLQFQGGWRVIKVHGPFMLSEVGVLASLVGPLAAARVSVLTIATFDTDYLLVASENLAQAVSALERAGHSFTRSSSQ